MTSNGSYWNREELNESNFMTPLYIATNVLCVLIAILTIFFNCFVVWAISRKDRAWDVSYCFLWHLAVVDAMNGVLLLYNVLYNLAYFQNFFECLFRYGCVHGIKVCSGFLLLAIGLERYIKIVYPFRYWSLLNEKTVKIYISCVWTMAVIVAFVPYLTWIENIPTNDFCQYFSILKPEFIWCFCLLMVIVLICQCFLYSHIFIIARNAWRSAPKGALQQGSSVALWWTPTKTVLIVLGTNLVTLGPVGAYLVTAVSGALDDWGVISKGVTLAYVATPGYVNSMVNPLLYAFKVQDIWEAFTTKLKPCSQRNKVHDIQSVSFANLENKI